MSELLPFLVPSGPRGPSGEAMPPDQAARVRALDPRLSCIVEAPAGSGKTGLLLQRYLKLLADDGVSQPEQVLAITFTRKATAELRERVLQQLSAAAAGEPLPDEASSFVRETRMLAEAVLRREEQLGWNLFEQPQRLRIRTIDSLCTEIVRTLPLLSGSGLNRPVESAEALYREAARHTLLELGGDDAEIDAAVETLLLHRDANLEDCESLLARMLEQRQQWGELVPLDAASLSEQHLDEVIRPRLEASLDAILCAGLRRACEVVGEDVLIELSDLAGRLALLPAVDPTSTPPLSAWIGRTGAPEPRCEDLPRWRALLHLLFTQSGSWRKRFNPGDLRFAVSYEDRPILKDVVSRLQSDGAESALLAIDSLPSPQFPDEQWQVAKALFRLLRRALAHLKVLFAETGQCDFTELALAACDALSGEEGVGDLARSPAADLTHLLVDEMQDTSSSQYTLLERLTRSWDGHSQTVFLVGDPKQSIYLFRQARVERFLRTAAEGRLGDVPLEALQLTANFRSQGALVEQFNDLFSRLFPATPTASPDFAADREVPFVRAQALRPPTEREISLKWHRKIAGRSGDALETKQSLREEEARSIRQTIEDFRREPLPAGRTKPWSIAVLARARKHFTAITTALSRDDGDGPIPFRAVDIDALSERSEVLDAFALTRALLHPADRIAWLAVLRAPWCGLTVADLLRLTGEGAEGDSDATVAELVAARGGLLSDDGRELLGRVWPTLATAAETAGRSLLSAHVERTWLTLGGDAPLSSECLANVQRFFSVLRELERESKDRIDLASLGARLEKLYAATAPNEDAVQLLTIHNSKGLEFDLVLVPGMERGTNSSHGDLLNWLELDSVVGEVAHILLAPIASRGEESEKLNKWIGNVRSSREHAETRRLLYVACTRAREELHLFATCELRKSGSVRKPARGTLLSAAWPFAEGLFMQPADARSEEEEDAVSADGVPQGAEQESGVLPFAPSPGFEEGLALAAAGEAKPAPPIHRLPRWFDPIARFEQSREERLPYTPASELPHAPSFDRPEGSFAVRAFGNVVHRFLQLLADRMAAGASAGDLLAELPSWERRVAAAFRNEGLDPAVAKRDSSRALAALQRALDDPEGRWILSPHPQATSERSIALRDSTVLRADRTFLAGAAPMSEGSSHLWIVDFKTAAQGSLSPEAFTEGELLKYRSQMERYASVLEEIADGPLQVTLALYYPVIPRLLHWFP